MGMALALARDGLGRTWPNPSVGCVIVKAGKILGQARTANGGRPHAETQALRQAGAQAKGATAYVTLEPCAHHGQTPPCVDALIQAGIGRVVIAASDPDPRVNGQGIERLRSAGIATESRVRASEAWEIYEAYAERFRVGYPFVTLKLATSLDGRIALKTGDSRWITGPSARAEVHRLRASHDAVMIGAGTALADDPLLTCRVAGLTDRSPLRIVVDSRLRLPAAAQLVKMAKKFPTWILTSQPDDSPNARALSAKGVRVVSLPANSQGSVEMASMAKFLSGEGLMSILAEGGQGLATALLTAGLIQRLVWFRAPVILGGDAMAAIGDLDRSSLVSNIQWVRQRLQSFDDDVMEIYKMEFRKD